VSVSLDAHGAPTLKLFADWSPTPKPPASMPPPAPPSPPTDATKKPTDATKKK
jgi:hypothetical protein